MSRAPMLLFCFPGHFTVVPARLRGCWCGAVCRPFGCQSSSLGHLCSLSSNERVLIKIIPSCLSSWNVSDIIVVGSADFHTEAVHLYMHVTHTRNYFSSSCVFEHLWALLLLFPLLWVTFSAAPVEELQIRCCALTAVLLSICIFRSFSGMRVWLSVADKFFREFVLGYFRNRFEVSQILCLAWGWASLIPQSLATLFPVWIISILLSSAILQSLGFLCAFQSSKQHFPPGLWSWTCTSEWCIKPYMDFWSSTQPLLLKFYPLLVWNSWFLLKFF